jgi:energy-coupling factor transport system permease protein
MVAIDSVMGQYYRRDSIIHDLDPRAKLTLLLLCIVISFLAYSFIGFAVLMGFLLLVMLLSRIPALAIAKALTPLAILVVFPLLFNVFFIQTGTPLFDYGVILITDDGLIRGAYMSLRLLFLFGIATMLTLTTSTIALSDAVASMLKPFERFGVPAFEISMMVSIALRFVPTIAESFGDIKKAQQARGATFGQGGPVRRLHSIIVIMVPLFAQAFRHAEDLAIAMESRCYHGGERTHYRELRFALHDLLASVVVILIAAILISLLILPIPAGF